MSELRRECGIVWKWECPREKQVIRQGCEEFRKCRNGVGELGSQWMLLSDLASEMATVLVLLDIIRQLHGNTLHKASEVVGSMIRIRRGRGKHTFRRLATSITS